MSHKVGDVLIHRNFIAYTLYGLIMDITDGRYCLLLDEDYVVFDKHVIEWYFRHV